MKSWKKRNITLPGILVLLFAITLGVECGDNDKSGPDGSARAYRSSTWAELIGGPDAYGMPGDFILENGKIRVLIQDIGESYGPGLYGGSILDADRVRKGRETCCGHGLDQFMEVLPTVNTLVPAVENLDPSSSKNGAGLPIDVTVKSDGSGGGPAIIRVQGQAAPLLTILGGAIDLLGIILPYARIYDFTIDYILAPGKDYVEIRSVIGVEGPDGTPIPAQEAIDAFDMFQALLAGDLVFGDALFFGVSVSAFGPPFGYYLDGYIWDLYTEQGTSTLNEPVSTRFVAASGDRVSYGLTTKIGRLQIPLFASSVSVVFSHLQPYNDSPTTNKIEFTNYFIVGEGDVASVLDSVYEIRQTNTGTVDGIVYDSVSYAGLSGVKVFAFHDPRDARWQSLNQDWQTWLADWNTDHPGEPYDLYDALLNMVTRSDLESPLLNVIETDKGEDVVPDGSYRANLEVPDGFSEGRYLLLAHDLTRPRGELVSLTVQSGVTTRQALKLDPPAKVRYEIRNGAGDPIPGKITFRGMPMSPDSQACRDDIMSLSCRRFGDHEPILGDGFMPDRLAKVDFTHTGQGSVLLPPGTYEYWVTRGPEYTMERGTITLEWRHVSEIHTVVRQVVNTTGFMSFDVHQHSQKSQDSGLPVRERLTTNVAEHLEILTGTDHDYIFDFSPLIRDMDINRYIHSIVSDELTTFELGHFIGFPLKYDPTKDGNGAPGWVGKTPNQIFDSLRDEAGYGAGKTIVHLAHPRDSLFGYFYLWDLDPAKKAKPADMNPAIRKSEWKTGSSILSIFNSDLVKSENFSEMFESFELLNAKRFELIRTPTHQEYENICEMTDGSEEDCEAIGKSTVYDMMERTLWEQDKILNNSSYRLESGFKQILDDWFAYLNEGINITATAGSDSHTRIRTEAGCPRNYLTFSTDQPMLATDREVTQRIWDKEVSISYGPYVEFSVNRSAGIGHLLTDRDGQVDLNIRIQTPGWFQVDRIEIYGNGLLIGEIDTDASVDPVTGMTRFSPWGPGEPKPFPEARCYTRGKTIQHDALVAFDDDVTCLVDEDTWFVVIAMGRGNMFPLYTSNDYPYIQIGALISIALGALGLPLDLGPAVSSVFPVHPYAMTNPIWVDVNGNGRYDLVTPRPPLPYSKSLLPEDQEKVSEFIRGLESEDRVLSKIFMNREYNPIAGPRPRGTYTKD